MIGHPVGIYSSWWVHLMIHDRPSRGYIQQLVGADSTLKAKVPRWCHHISTTRAQPLVVPHSHTLCSCLRCTMKQSVHWCRAFDLRSPATTYTHQKPNLWHNSGTISGTIPP